jgi:HSP20 family protein
MVQVKSQSDPQRPASKPLSEARASGTGPGRWRLVVRTPLWHPPTDVFETDEAFVVRVEIAGMKDEDFSIELDQNTLLIHGVRSDWPERRAYHQMEIYFGEFGLQLDLPGPVIVDQVQADYQDGFLRVALPKARPLQVRIENQE